VLEFLFSLKRMIIITCEKNIFIKKTNNITQLSFYWIQRIKLD